MITNANLISLIILALSSIIMANWKDVVAAHSRFELWCWYLGWRGFAIYYAISAVVANSSSTGLLGMLLLITLVD